MQSSLHYLLVTFLSSKRRFAARGDEIWNSRQKFYYVCFEYPDLHRYYRNITGIANQPLPALPHSEIQHRAGAHLLDDRLVARDGPGVRVSQDSVEALRDLMLIRDDPT